MINESSSDTEPCLFGGSQEQFWQRASSLALGLASLAVQRSHGLHLLAAHAQLSRQIPLPEQLRRDWEAAQARSLIVPIVIGQLASAVDEPVVLLKGAEIAHRYPVPAARGFSDIDILVQDLPAALDNLRRAGFRELEIPVAGHHVAVQAPGIPFPIEVHSRLKWPRWATPPSTTQLVRDSVPSQAFPGLARTLQTDLHTVYVAAHAWTHCPLAQLSDLIDITVLAARSNATQLATRAAECGLDRLWDLSIQAGRAVFSGERPSSPLVRRLLPDASARAALSHRGYVLRQFAGGLAAPRPAAQARAVADVVSDHLVPQGDESLINRMAALVRGALLRDDEHSHQRERAERARRVAPETNRRSETDWTAP